MKKLSSFILLFISISANANNISSDIYTDYNQKLDLTKPQIDTLSNTKIIFIPGILAETFIRRDRRSRVELSYLTSEYFGTIINSIRQKYKLDILRLSTSSKSMEETKSNIKEAINKSSSENKKVIFISHSLGGLALLDYLIENPNENNKVIGNIFFQSPFYGTGIADIYERNPYYIRSILRHILPYLNTSAKVIKSMNTEFRNSYMDRNQYSISKVTSSIPTITVAGNAVHSRSLFKPAVDLLKFGCIKFFNRCLGRKLLFTGLGDNDGMVPIESSKLPAADFVILNNVDHGETVVSSGFSNIERSRITESLIKTILSKQR